MGAASAASTAKVVAAALASPSSGWELAATGAVTTFGGAPSFGSPSALTAPASGIAATPDGHGYWVVDGNGRIYSFGDAVNVGATKEYHTADPVVAIAATPDGHGYWEATASGRVFHYGDAAYKGEATQNHPGDPVVAIAATPDGLGYWEETASGLIFNFGDAHYTNEATEGHSGDPMVGLAATPDGLGYWEVTSDGLIFNFGDAPYRGAVAGSVVAGSVVAVLPAAKAGGYTVVEKDGTTTAFGSAVSTSPTTVAPTTTTVPAPTTTVPAPTTTVPAPTTTTVPAPTTTVAAPPTTTVPPATQVNSVADVIADMNNPNEGFPHGVPSYYNWYSGPVLYPNANTPPTTYQAITMWGQVYEAAQGSTATNIRVELRAAQCWVWSISQHKWIELLNTPQVQGAHFDESFATNNSINADLRNEPDGGISTTMVPDYNFHFWPTGNRATINPSDVGGVYTTVQARLIEDNPTGTNDLSAAKYLVNVGADYWTTTTSAYPNNAAVFEGRFDYASPQWQSFNAISWTANQVLANPPPVADAPTS